MLSSPGLAVGDGWLFGAALIRSAGAEVVVGLVTGGGVTGGARRLAGGDGEAKTRFCKGGLGSLRIGLSVGTVAEGATVTRGEGTALTLTGGGGGVIVGACFGTDAFGTGDFPTSRTSFRGAVAVGKGVALAGMDETGEATLAAVAAGDAGTEAAGVCMGFTICFVLRSSSALRCASLRSRC